ncbi:MAG: hypothetical protein U1E40_10300 [Amaricoccus sp.]
MTPDQWTAIRPKTDPAIWPAVDILVTRPAGLYDIINVSDVNSVEDVGSVLSLFGFLPTVDQKDGLAAYGHVNDPVYEVTVSGHYDLFVAMQPEGWTPAARVRA